MMWKLVLTIVLLQVAYGFSESVETYQEPLWNLNTLQPIPQLRLVFSDSIKQRFQPYKANEMAIDHNSQQKSHEKRAFSILARLRPFSDLGKQRTSIRQASRGPAPLAPLSDLDIVSAETRAMLRPIGQPLRWG